MRLIHPLTYEALPFRMIYMEERPEARMLMYKIYMNPDFSFPYPNPEIYTGLEDFLVRVLSADLAPSPNARDQILNEILNGQDHLGLRLPPNVGYTLGPRNNSSSLAVLMGEVKEGFDLLEDRVIEDRVIEDRVIRQLNSSPMRATAIPSADAWGAFGQGHFELVRRFVPDHYASSLNAEWEQLSALDPREPAVFVRKLLFCLRWISITRIHRSNRSLEIRKDQLLSGAESYLLTLFTADMGLGQVSLENTHALLMCSVVASSRLQGRGSRLPEPFDIFHRALVLLATDDQLLIPETLLPETGNIGDMRAEVRRLGIGEALTTHVFNPPASSLDADGQRLAARIRFLAEKNFGIFAPLYQDFLGGELRRYLQEYQGGGVALEDEMDSLDLH